MNPSAAAAAAAAAAMNPNFVLFPFLDQLHHQTSGGFPSQLQTMQPFLQKNNVSSSCSLLKSNFSIACVLNSVFMTQLPSSFVNKILIQKLFYFLLFSNSCHRSSLGLVSNCSRQQPQERSSPNNKRPHLLLLREKETGLSI